MFASSLMACRISSLYWYWSLGASCGSILPVVVSCFAASVTVSRKGCRVFRSVGVVRFCAAGRVMYVQLG